MTPLFIATPGGYLLVLAIILPVSGILLILALGGRWLGGIVIATLVG